MNNITIGQYIPGDSWIYKMDPRLKIILTFLYMIIVFMLPSFISMVIALAIFIILFLTTKLPLLKIIKGIKGVLFLLIFTFVLQVIYTKEGELLLTIPFQIGLYHALIIAGIIIFYYLTKKFISFKFIYLMLIVVLVFVIQHYITFSSFVWSNYKFNIYTDGLQKGGYILLRIILMISITSLLTISTMSTDINNGMSAVMSPLKIIKVPVGIISMMLSLTLRFIPTLLEETHRIMKAQASRGVDFTEGKLRDKVTQIIALLVPMFVISIRRAEDLANAMEARGYIIDAPRTKLDLLKFKTLDYFALVISLMCLGLVVYLKIAS